VKFLKVKSHFFKTDLVYSFHIYLYDNDRKKRFVSLYQNSPVSLELSESWEKLEKSGGYLQIEANQLETFVKETQFSEDEVKKLNENYYKYYFLYERRLEKYFKKTEDDFNFISELKRALTQNKFELLYERFRAEVMCFPLHLSSTISMVTGLIDDLPFKEDKLFKKLVFAYFLAKHFKVSDIEVLSELIVAILLKDIGRTQLSLEMNQTAFKLQKNDESFRKHPLFAIYVLSKHSYSFSKNIKRFILEQDELVDGSGFPRGKHDDKIHMVSQVIHFSNTLIEFGFDDQNQKYDFFLILKRIASGVEVSSTPVAFNRQIIEFCEGLQA
jgi:hypothetical protein